MRGVVAVDVLGEVVLVVLQRVDAAGARAGAVRDDDSRAAADLLEPCAVLFAREAALDQRDVDALGGRLGHRLSELHDVDVLEQLESGRRRRSW